MNTLKHTMKVIVIILFISLSSCNEKYPDLGDGLYAEFVTNKGTMVAKLTFEKTPVTVANFVALAEGNHPMADSTFKGKKFYNGLIFHRVIDKFMIQGGDPTGTGSGSPGYKFGDEFDETLKHDKPGILSMANSGPATNGSQFFITETPRPNLDNRHSVFGELVLGLEIQDTISNVKTAARNKPVEDVIIEELNIIRQGFAARKFDAVKVWETELPKLEERKKQREEEARKKAEEAQKIKVEKTEAASAEILPIITDYKSKAKTLASGLMIHYIIKGNGVKPNQGQSVKINYEGYFTDGRLFDSNRKELEEKYGMYNPRKEEGGYYGPMPMKISPDALMIAGFKEGAAAMRVGDKAYLYIPSHLAYGENGRGQIQPDTDLIFIIEMIEIVK
jgi:peptidyl-prolyl cis-trans isomerase A (cyclophilin A)